MMSRQLFTGNLFRISGSLIIFFLLSINLSFAEEEKKLKGPIIITSEILTADNKTHTAIFENSVVARTTDITIYADRMLVHYNKDTGNVTSIEAEGRVKLNELLASTEVFVDGARVPGPAARTVIVVETPALAGSRFDLRVAAQGTVVQNVGGLWRLSAQPR